MFYSLQVLSLYFTKYFIKNEEHVEMFIEHKKILSTSDSEISLRERRESEEKKAKKSSQKFADKQQWNHISVDEIFRFRFPRTFTKFTSNSKSCLKFYFSVQFSMLVRSKTSSLWKKRQKFYTSCRSTNSISRNSIQCMWAGRIVSWQL